MMRHLLLFSLISLSVEVAWLQIKARNVSCERAEAINASYMKGFQAGKTEGIRVAVETVKREAEQKCQTFICDPECSQWLRDIQPIQKFR